MYIYICIYIYVYIYIYLYVYIYKYIFHLITVPRCLKTSHGHGAGDA